MLRTSVRFVFMLALAFGSASRTTADTYVRQPAIDARHYVFQLTLLMGDSNEIQGETTATFRLVSDGVREIVLDFASPTADAKGMTVTAVTSAGRAVAFRHSDNHLRLPVPAQSPTGQEVSFAISYHGVPANGLRLIDNIHGDRTAFSENWHNQARQWLPMIDHPADKATGEFIVTTRAEYQVIANGALVEQVDLGAGQRRTHWKQSAPISSWLYALGVARFAVRHAGNVRGVPLEYWVFPQDAEQGFALFERDARAAFEFFSDRVGPFVYDRLAHVQAAGMGGGIENASNIFYGEKGVSAGNGPVVHETAHQWFGDAVTERDWNDVWLSEGFATYFTLLYTEFASGRDAFVDGVRRSRNAVLLPAESEPASVILDPGVWLLADFGPFTKTAAAGRDR
jgi:aminopeptidase N